MLPLHGLGIHVKNNFSSFNLVQNCGRSYRTEVQADGHTEMPEILSSITSSCHWNKINLCCATKKKKKKKKKKKNLVICCGSCYLLFVFISTKNNNNNNNNNCGFKNKAGLFQKVIYL